MIFCYTTRLSYFLPLDGWKVMRYKTKQNSWITLILDHQSFCGNSDTCIRKQNVSVVLLVCHDDKFHFWLAFFGDAINEIFIRLRLTYIKFPWIQGKQTRHFKKTFECASFNSLHTETPSALPEMGSLTWQEVIRDRTSNFKEQNWRWGEDCDLPSNRKCFNRWQNRYPWKTSA